MRITVYDTDGANPYGREVAVLVAEHADVEAILPVDVGWLPEQLRHRRLLPANGPAGIVAQLIRQWSGLLAAGWDALARRRVIIVIMTRAWYDQMILGLLGRLGARLVVVAHDPVPKTPLSPLQTFARRLLWRSARVLVAHSPKLVSETEDASGREAFLVPHLPFMVYGAWAQGIAPHIAGTGRLRLLVLGQMRHDKGLDRLPAIFERIPVAPRDRMTLGFAGRGNLDDVVSKVGALVTVSRPISKHRLSDREIAESLAETDVLIAPYPLVSASGSVVLALCRDVKVVAYDAGAIRDVLASDGLVPPGDEAAFAARLVSALTDGGAGPREPLAEWRQRSLEAWLAALNMAGHKRAG